jgi:hypothetical protein
MPLENEFDREMHEVYETGVLYGYHAHIFLKIIEEHGEVEAAKRLLAADGPQEGLYRLWELHLLNHSMEALVIKDRYAPLFTAEEIAEAKKRLIELGYNI